MKNETDIKEITIRDFFAAQALVLLPKSRHETGLYELGDWDLYAQEVAEHVFLIADAMIAARNKK